MAERTEPPAEAPHVAQALAPRVAEAEAAQNLEEVALDQLHVQLVHLVEVASQVHLHELENEVQPALVQHVIQQLNDVRVLELLFFPSLLAQVG